MMALVRWFFGRFKRIIPAAVIIFGLIVIYKYVKRGHLVGGESRDEVLRMKMPAPEPEIDRWIVVWSKDENGQACSQSSMQFPHWRILIVGTKSNYTGPSSCVYFTADAAAQFSRTLTNTDQAASDLTLAYLYLIKMGAAAVYIPPPGSLTSQHQPHLFMRATHRGLVYSSSSTYDSNILSHFGCKGTVKSHQATYTVGKFKAPALQAPIIFPAKESSVPTCDVMAPPITLNKGTYTTHFSLHGALFLREALWALPVLEFSNEVEDVAWMLTIQHLLWVTDNSLQLWHNQFNEEVRYVGHHDKIIDIALEIQEKLHTVQCTGLTFEKCVDEILEHLRKNQYMNNNVMEQIRLWVGYLKLVGYTVISQTQTQQSAKSTFLPQVSEAFNATFNPVDYNQPVYRRKPNTNPFVPAMNVKPITKLMRDKCSEHPMPSHVQSNMTHPWHQFEGTLLLVTFNMAHYEAIPYVESLYRGVFPRILYCGPDMIDYDEVPALKEFDISFVSYGGTPRGHWPGAFNYDCVTLAASMHYPVTGYMTMSDDVLLSIYRLKNLPLHQPWYLPLKKIRVGDLNSLRECKLGMCDFFPHWRWWEDYQTEIVLALQQLQRNARLSQLFYRCYISLVAQNGGEKRANGGFADVHYLPAHQVQDFATLARFFRQHEVFLEIAVPTIFTCLNNPEDIARIPGIDILDETRETPWQYFTTRDYRDKCFLHPTKWGFMTEDRKDYKQFYCSMILPFIHDPYGRIR